ncbi:MAG: SDR family NAD(P)-dependent oxidoreductase [Phycisphaerales bacterium]
MALPGDEAEAIQRALRGRRVCVTGGAGFIGGHLSRALLETGCEVCIIDDLSASTGERLDELFEIAGDALDFVHGSILDPGALFDAVDGCHLVYHLAAMASVTESMQHPQRSFDVNATGTLRVAEAARETRAARLIYAASSSAYGDAPTPHREHQAARPQSPYAAGKLAGEEIVQSWASSMGLDGVSLRFFNVFGPGQADDSPYAAVIPNFRRRLLAGEAPVIHGDGEQTRDFIAVTEVVRALLLAGASSDALRGETVNLGCGNAVTVNELARIMARLVGREDLAPVHEGERAGDVRHSVADMAKAYAVLGFQARGDLESGLADLVMPTPGAGAATER